MNTRPQPVLAAAVSALTAEVIGLVVAFGVPVTDDQRIHIIGVIAAAGPIIGVLSAWWASRKVTPLEAPEDDHGRRLTVHQD